ncbi:MAG: 2OG-Fe(II) oxygenase [Sphingomicrobium sp.]
MTAVDNAYRALSRGDAPQALAELERAAEAGDPGSLLELGVWRLEGRYIPRDVPLSREYFRKAGEFGDARAEHVYVCFLANGIGGDADWPSARNRLRELAIRDERAARQCELIGSMDLTSDGYPTNRPQGCQISTHPEAFVFDGFASTAECKYLIGAAKPLLAQSVIVDPATGQMRPHPVRTSDGAAFPWVSEDLVISALNRRIASGSGTDIKSGEPLQVLRYRPGQEYRPHLDALPTGENQRVLTMLVYLNEAYEGGETLFTRTGLKFTGTVGDALLFRNASPGGLPDHDAEHAGLPVTAGEKFVASRWIRERPIFAG